MKIKKGSIVKIIASKPLPQQDELDLNDFIGVKCEVIEHWNLKNTLLSKGQLLVDLPNEGYIILNKGEYEII